ncbi:3-mercaptopyruvate sulfurtransferase [Alphaproteobacteria bacterium HT1-32]|nr:3-mercaptopyruvate sulfurtransferase [Alphaproteobacteria bacterium HT1-32]
MPYSNPEALVSVDWLAAHIDAPDVRVIDASFYLPTETRNADAEYAEGHIPGAIRFDIEEICDPDSDLPHMLPSPEMFSSRVRNLGLGDGIRIIAYDQKGHCAAASRAWWMFRVFGHHDVAVLNGGLPAWKAAGHAVEQDQPVLKPRHFTARFDSTMVRNYDQVKRNIDAGKFQTVDARTRGRFDGTAPEPRKELRSGHIPKSLSLPYDQLIDPATQKMLPAGELEKRIADAGIDPNRPIVATCGSGVTACVPALALYLLGHRNVAIYDGSWTEWAGRPDSPILP